MRNPILPLVLVCGCMLSAVPSSQAQITVKVDSTKAWAGYMNVYDLTAGGGQGGYLWGSGWGLADLRGYFTAGTTLTLTPNTNVFNPTDAYWAKPDGTGAKWMEASFYVDVGNAFQGQEVTFMGDTLSNTVVSPWTTVAVIKEFAPGYAWVGQTTTPLVTGEPFTVTRTIQPGNIAQYGFVTTGPDCNPTNLVNAGKAVLAVNNSDPSITRDPTSQRVAAGGTASFTVTAVGTGSLRYQWKRYGTNLVNGANVSGATNATLTISNAQLADATTYKVEVTNPAGKAESLAAALRVLTPEQFANALDNPGFEFEVIDPAQVPAPWFNFSGSALVNTNQGYAFDPGSPIKTKDGTNVVQVYNQGEWNGIYQDVPAAPGDAFTADGWFYMSSLDMLFGDTGVNLEIQFRAGPTVLQQYTSARVTTASPQDTWMFLQATNGVPSGFATLNSSNAFYLVAPAGTDRVRFQVTMHNVSLGSGNVYLDLLRLMKKIPVTVTTSLSSSQVRLSWLSQGATSYQVVYKDNLTDSGWTPLGTPIPGDGTVISVSYPSGSGMRYYSVLTQ